jgi:hypothetical protein
VTGDSDNPPPPHVILEAKPGLSEAEFLLDVDRMRALVTRHGELSDELAKLHTAFTGPPDLKKAATVWALVAFLQPDMPPASLWLVLDLLSPQQTQRYNELVRGLIAAAVAVLRSAAMENLQIKQWLGEIKRRPALDFQAGDAMRWFFDCNSGKVPRGALQAFRDLRPATSLSLTEPAAKERTAKMLDTVAAMKAGRLTRPRRRD